MLIRVVCLPSVLCTRGPSVPRIETPHGLYS